MNNKGIDGPGNGISSKFDKRTRQENKNDDDPIKTGKTLKGISGGSLVDEAKDASLHLPDSIVANISSFSKAAPMNKAISKDLLYIYKETIVKRLHVSKEIVDALESSDITRLFHKLNDIPKPIKALLTMGFSLKQIATIPSDQLSEYMAQFYAYNIPPNIQNQIDNLTRTNGELRLDRQELTTGQLCKILNALNDDQRNALTELDLWKNQLTSLPDSFGNLSALTRLFLSNNQLTSLPDSFGNCSALMALHLGINQLTSLPDSFGNLSALTHLDLSNNQFTSLPDLFGNLSALTVLYLHTNQLISLPDSFGDLSALTRLYLQNNQLTSLPDSFKKLTTLKDLFLYNNKLTSLPNSLSNLFALRMLLLNDNNFDDNLKNALQQQYKSFWSLMINFNI